MGAVARRGAGRQSARSACSSAPATGRPPAVRRACSAAARGHRAFSVATAMTPHHGAIPNAVGTASQGAVRRCRWRRRSQSAAERRRGPTAISPPAGRHPHPVVGRDERFAVGRRARDRVGHGGDGDRRMERRPGADLQQFIDDVHAGQDLLLRRGGPRRGRRAVHGEVIRSANCTPRRTPARSPTGSPRTIRPRRSADRRYTA